jgi:hypothetical protein
VKWNDAMESLDRYPWPHLRPTRVDPKFRKRVFDSLDRHPDGGATAVQRWKDALDERA